jgi:hypothetical protein
VRSLRAGWLDLVYQLAFLRITPDSAGMDTVARRLLGYRPELDGYERATPRIVLAI